MFNSKNHNASGDDSPAAWDESGEQQLWEEHWHLFCHRSEVAEPHAFLKLDIFQEEVVVFNDGHELVAFDNRCPHRGARIFESHSGKQRWVCPYHGWAFLKGKFYIPQKETFRDSDPKQAQLNRYHMTWVGDFLFVSKRPRLNISDQLGIVEPILSSISKSMGEQRDMNAYEYKSNWKIAVENALDQYHVPLVHEKTLSRLNLGPAKDEYVGSNNISRAEIGDDKVARKLRSIKRLFDLKINIEGYIAIYIFPYTFLTSTFGYSYSLQQFYPSIDNNRSFFTSRFYTGRLAQNIQPNSLAAFFDSSIELNHQVFKEDAGICARIPYSSWSIQAGQYVCDGESKVLEFRRRLGAWVLNKRISDESTDKIGEV